MSFVAAGVAAATPKRSLRTPKFTTADPAESFENDKKQERMGRLQLFSIDLEKDAEASKERQRSKDSGKTNKK